MNPRVFNNDKFVDVVVVDNYITMTIAATIIAATMCTTRTCFEQKIACYTTMGESTQHGDDVEFQNFYAKPNKVVSAQEFRKFRPYKQKLEAKQKTKPKKTIRKMTKLSE